MPLMIDGFLMALPLEMREEVYQGIAIDEDLQMNPDGSWKMPPFGETCKQAREEFSQYYRRVAPLHHRAVVIHSHNFKGLAHQYYTTAQYMYRQQHPNQHHIVLKIFLDNDLPNQIEHLHDIVRMRGQGQIIGYPMEIDYDEAMFDLDTVMPILFQDAQTFPQTVLAPMPALQHRWTHRAAIFYDDRYEALRLPYFGRTRRSYRAEWTSCCLSPLSFRRRIFLVPSRETSAMRKKREEHEWNLEKHVQCPVM